MIETEGRFIAKAYGRGLVRARKTRSHQLFISWCDFFVCEGDYKMANMRRSPQFRGDIWFQRQVRERTRESLLKQNNEFAAEHRLDTEEELLEYVRAFSKVLGRTPNSGEIIGGWYISSRFNGWENVVSAANLPKPIKMPAFENRLIYKNEYKRQEKLLRQERIEGKDAAKEQRIQKDTEGRIKEMERQSRDMVWGTEHAQDTDTQLVDYVRRCAKELGHSPNAQEVLGAAYIAQRFGSWAVVLTISGLPLPKGVKAPNPKTLKSYLERIKNE